MIDSRGKGRGRERRGNRWRERLQGETGIGEIFRAIVMEGLMGECMGLDMWGMLEGEAIMEVEGIMEAGMGEGIMVVIMRGIMGEEIMAGMVVELAEGTEEEMMVVGVREEIEL